MATFFSLVVVSCSLTTYKADSHSLRQLGPCLLRRHIRCVPVRPIRVALPAALLVIAVGGCCAPDGACQIVCRTKGRRRRVGAARQPYGDLLDDPHIAVGILERNI